MKEQEKYNLRRDEALQALKKRRAEAMLRSHAIKALLSDQTRLHVQRGLLLAQDADAAGIERRLADIRQDILAELARLGYPADHLELQPFCTLCNDSGSVLGERCSCAHEQREYLTFENYNINIFPDGPQRANAQKLLEYAENFVNQYPFCGRMNILLSGNTGLGKSYLFSCMAGELAKRGVRAELFTAYEFILSVMDNVIKKNDYSLLNRLRRTPVLILDDLGAEPLIPNITHEYMFNLIDSRNSRGLSTLIATNLTPGSLEERYGARTLSRLLDRAKTRAIRLEGVDLRTHI